MFHEYKHGILIPLLPFDECSLDKLSNHFNVSTLEEWFYYEGPLLVWGEVEQVFLNQIAHFAHVSLVQFGQEPTQDIVAPLVHTYFFEVVQYSVDKRVREHLYFHWIYDIVQGLVSLETCRYLQHVVIKLLE